MYGNYTGFVPGMPGSPGTLADIFGPAPLFTQEQLYQLSAPPIQAFQQRPVLARRPLRSGPPQSRDRQSPKQLARIEKLPEELIAAIYHYYLYDVLLMRRNNFAPVCRLFHRIASDSCSYNNLAIAIPCNAGQSLRLASLLSKASPRKPLYIDLTLQASIRDFRTPDTDLQPVLQYAPRLKRLTFTIRGFNLGVLRDLRRARNHVRLDALETFALENDNVQVRDKSYIHQDGEAFEETLDVLKTATALQKFRIFMECSSDCDLAPVLDGLRNLRFLFIHSNYGSFHLDTASIVTILQNCPYLTTFACTLRPRSGTPVHPSFSSTQNQIINRYLTSFELHVMGSHTEMILAPSVLEVLTVRHLNTLNVTWPETRNDFKRATVRALSRLVGRSRCPLRYLTLSGVRTNAPEFFGCVTRSMQQLTLRNGENGEPTLLGGAGANALVKAGYELCYSSQRTQVFAPRR